MTNQKRFSVIMAVRNGENFIKKALQSLIENLKVNDELIVVDDNSTDNSADIIKNFLDTKINYTIIHLKKNVGPAKARNIALKKANGKFITFLDHDDYFPKKRLENHLKIFRKYKHVDIVRGFAKFIFMNKRLLKLSREENKYNKRITSFGIIKGSELLGSLSFRKRIFNKINLNSKFKYGEDTDLIFKLVIQGYKFYNQKKIALFYRIHGKNMTLTKKHSVFGKDPSKLKKIIESRKFINKSIIRNLRLRIKKSFL